jgi:hypothetical protein
VFCSFLALVLKAALEDRIAALGRAGSWPEIVADLDSLTETEIAHEGKRFLVRAAPRRQPRLARGRRRAAAHRPRRRGDLTLGKIRKCSATPPAWCGLLLPLSYLENRTVEDGLDTSINR